MLPVTATPVVLATIILDTPPTLIIALPFNNGILILLEPLTRLDDVVIPDPEITSCPPTGLVSIRLSLVPDVIELSPN